MNATPNRTLSAAWKVALMLLGLTVFVIGMIITVEWYKDFYGRKPWADKSLTKDVIVEAYNNNRVRVRNLQTGRYTTPKMKWVSGAPLRDSLTVFCDKNDRRGFLNVKNGEIVIPAQYGRAWQFSEGLAAVLGEDDRIGFINCDNQLVIGYEIPYVPGFDYIFKDGFCTVKFWEVDKWRYAVYGRDGHQVLGWCYTRVDDPNEDGYRVVGNEDGCGLYDRYFNKIWSETYDNMELAPDKAGVYVTRNHVKQLVDYEGKVIEPFVIDGSYRLHYMTRYNSDEPDDYELVSDIAVYQVDNWEGLLDIRTGKPITPAKYWKLEMISRDLIRAKLDCDGASVVLDRRGRAVGVL